MKKYAITVSGDLKKTVIVEASTPKEAMDKAENAVKNCDIILSYDDLRAWGLDRLRFGKTEKSQTMKMLIIIFT